MHGFVHGYQTQLCLDLGLYVLVASCFNMYCLKKLIPNLVSSFSTFRLMNKSCPIVINMNNHNRFKVQGSRFFIIRHILNHTSIISSEMQVELKKNTAFTFIIIGFI